MAVYYNEIDPFAAAWLRELIKRGHIAPGDVDERSIVNVSPNELAGYTQCHFFAGVGVWSYALRLAGISDSERVWTGSCPCQPFSTAGKGAGFDDERHLWPAWQWLIQQCRPPKIYGEQVASKTTNTWFDLVQTDLEAMGYAFGCVPFPSAGVGAPHLRDRAFWVAHTSGEGSQEFRRDSREPQPERLAEAGATCGLADTEREGSQGRSGAFRYEKHKDGQADPLRPTIRLADTEREQYKGSDSQHGILREAEAGGKATEPAGFGETVGLADTCGDRYEQTRQGKTEAGSDGIVGNGRIFEGEPNPSATNGFWRDVDWLYCRDGKWRPVRPGSFPLADGPAARVGRLRGYGNAINAQAAKAFIEATDGYFKN